MVSLQQLLDLRTDDINSAADAWQDLADKVAAHGNAVQGVAGRLGTGWAGTAAEAAQGHVNQVASTLSSHEQRLRSVSQVLRTGASNLAGAQSALRSTLNAAQRYGVDIGADGSVSVNPARMIAAGMNPAELEALPQVVEKIGTAIKQALQFAGKTDKETADALRRHGVSAGPSTLVSMRPQMLPPPDGGSGTGNDPNADAQTAAQLAEQLINYDQTGQGSDLTAAQWQQLETILDEDSNDPQFATAFANALGPQNYLAFTGMVSLESSRDQLSGGNLQGTLADIQIQLGMGLATATDDNQQPNVGSDWVNQLEAAGRQPINIGVANYQPYGYQMLGVLMQNSQVPFSTDFLNSVGNDLTQFDQQHQGIWQQDRPPITNFSLNLCNDTDGGGAGYDPMTGLMTAMSQNQQASEQFFDPQNSNHLDYLLHQRTWSPDVPSNTLPPDGYQPPGTQALSQALAATANGTHDEAAARIMSETVKQLSADNGADIPANMKPSLGTMVKSYISDVNYVTMHGDDTIGTNGALTAWQDPATPGSTDVHAVFNPQQLNAVLDSVSKDPTAMVTMANAEKAYTGLQFRAIATDNSLSVEQRQQDIGTYGQNSANVLGRITANYIHAKTAAETAAYNDAINKEGMIANIVIGGAANDIPIVGGAAATGVSDLIDNIVSNAQQNSAAMTQQELDKQYSQSGQAIGDLAFNAMWQNKLWPPNDSPLVKYPDLADSNGNPIDLNQLGGRRQELDAWIGDTKGTNYGYGGYWQPQLDKISNGYELGWLDPTNS